MYAGGNKTLQGKAMQSGESGGEYQYINNRGYMPRALRRGFAGDEFDYWNRDESLYFGVPQELETSGSDTNAAYAGLRAGFALRRGYGRGFGATRPFERRFDDYRGFGVVPVVGALESVAGSLIHLGSTAPQNLQDNAYLYNEAITTKNPQWLLNLATVSGSAGVAAGIPSAGVPSATTPWRSGIGATLLGGWGSASAESDAVAKYQAATAALKGTQVGLLQTILGGGGGVAGSPNQPGSTVVSTAGLLGGVNLTSLALIGVGAFVLSKVFKA